MVKSLKTKQDILDALHNAIVSIREAYNPIDELNGYLLELDEIDCSGLSEPSVKALEEAHRLFMSLPVWDTLDHHIQNLEGVFEEVKGTKGNTAELLEKLTEESPEDVEELCPKCEVKKVLDALSREDNETMICSDCGTEEAMKEAGF